MTKYKRSETGFPAINGDGEKALCAQPLHLRTLTDIYNTFRSFISLHQLLSSYCNQVLRTSLTLSDKTTPGSLG